MNKVYLILQSKKLPHRLTNPEAIFIWSESILQLTALHLHAENSQLCKERDRKLANTKSHPLYIQFHCDTDWQNAGIM